MNLFSLMILLGGLSWLLMRFANASDRRCPECGMPGASMLGGGHWPGCPRGKFWDDGTRVQRAKGDE